MDTHITDIPSSKMARLLFADTRMSWLWLLVRLYLGYEWLSAGWGKFNNPAWVGTEAGAGVKGFLLGALTKTGGAHPDVSWWYASFVQNFALQHTVWFSYLVTFGELAVGAALVLGFITGLAAFFGVFMNCNFLLAGTVSVNPVMVLLGLLLMLSWRTAGRIGLDRFVLPKLFPPPRGF